jgi:hypothetical protein
MTEDCCADLHTTLGAVTARSLSANHGK